MLSEKPLCLSIGFFVSRWLVQDWVRKRLPQRFVGWEKRFVNHALLSTIALRVVTGYAPAADWFLGISKVRWREFLIGTIIGLIPVTFHFCGFGRRTRWLSAPNGLSFSQQLGMGWHGTVPKHNCRAQPSEGTGQPSPVEGQGSPVH